MSHLNVLKHPNTHLREHARLLSDEEILSDEIRALTENMVQTMQEEQGVGLAAPQVDEQVRLIVCEVNDKIVTLANPKIVSRSMRMKSGLEGCLSIPNIWGHVKRHAKVKVRGKNIDGETVVINASGLLSVVLQHEIDHLEGILFIDRAHDFETDIPTGIVPLA